MGAGVHFCGVRLAGLLRDGMKDFEMSSFMKGAIKSACGDVRRVRRVLPVLLQGHPDLEYIIIDGGCTDGSVDIISKYEKWLVYRGSEPDQGQSHAINKGLRQAHEEILAYLNSDDTHLPKAASLAVDCFVGDSEMDMVYGDCNVINEQSQVIMVFRSQEFHLAQHVRSHTILQQTVFFPERVIGSVGCFDPSLHYIMDWEFWIRVTRCHKMKRTPHITANLQWHSGRKSITHRLGLDYLYCEYLAVFDLVAQDDELASYLNLAARRRRGLACWCSGLASYGQSRGPRDTRPFHSQCIVVCTLVARISISTPSREVDVPCATTSGAGNVRL